VRKADWTAAVAESVPVELAISGFEGRMRGSEGGSQSGSSSYHARPWKATRAAVLNGSLTIIVLTPLTTFPSRPLWSFRQAFEVAGVFQS
jgi:hypothetical protein